MLIGYYHQLTSCGLSNMASKFETVNVNDPNPSSSCWKSVNIDAILLKMYFAKSSQLSSQLEF